MKPTYWYILLGGLVAGFCIGYFQPTWPGVTEIRDSGANIGSKLLPNS